MRSPGGCIHTPYKTDIGKILPLTSIRFFAALYVVAFHALSVSLATDGHSGVLARFVGLGYVSVSFFFVLSGFVLAISYLNTGHPVDVRRFFVARFARLYPLILATMLLDLPHTVYSERHFLHHSTGRLVAMGINSVGVLAAWFPNLGGLDTPVWSVSVEIFFYLLFPWIGALIWRMRASSMWLFAVVTYVAGGALLGYMISIHADAEFLNCNPVLHLYEFLLGICTARLFVFLVGDKKWELRLKRFAPAFFVTSILLFLAIPVFDIPIPRLFLQHGITFPIYALVILSVSSGQKTLSALLSAKWLVVLGEASFALYLIHYPLGLLLRTRLIVPYGYWGVGAYMLLAIGLSVASFFWLETPSRRWIMKRMHVKKQEDAATLALAQ